MFRLFSARNRPQLPDQLDDGRADRDKNNRGQNKYYQWGNHLDGGLCRLFFGPLPAFRAEGIGMHPESLGDAGAEAISLNQCTHKRADVVNPGAIDQIAESLGPGLAGAHLEVYQVEFFAEIGMGMVQILADAHQGLVEGEAGLNANDGEVEGVGQADADAVLAVFDHALQDEAWQEKAEAGNACEQEEVVETGKQGDAGKARGSHQEAGAEVIVDVDGVTIPGLNEPGAGAGNIGGRKRDGLSQGIERLLHALAKGRLALDGLLLMSPEGAQTGAEDGVGSDDGGAKGEHYHHHGEEYDDDQEQGQHGYIHFGFLGCWRRFRSGDRDAAGTIEIPRRVKQDTRSRNDSAGLFHSLNWISLNMDFVKSDFVKSEKLISLNLISLKLDFVKPGSG